MSDKTVPSDLPPSLIEAMKRKPPAGGLGAVKHVVLLMQENRSFDHYFGKGVDGVRGFEDRNTVLLPDGKTSVLKQPDGDDHVGPHQWPAPGVDYDADIAHDWATGHQAWHDGWWDRWIEAKRDKDHPKAANTMGYYDQPEVVGFYRKLAGAFTICDGYHSSVMGETTSNRNYLFSGFGGWEPTGERVTGTDAHKRERDPGDPGAYNWTSYPELLEANGVSWQVYQEWDNFYDNNLEFHDRFKRIATSVLKGMPKKYVSMYRFYHPVDDDARPPGPDDISDNDLEALDGEVKKLSSADRSLFERGLRRQRPSKNGGGVENIRGFVQAFKADVEAGKLPQVSYLVSSARDSEHPGNSSPGYGQQIAYQVLDAIASNTDVWDSTIVLISYDENDGLFDHVPPPVPPGRWDDEFVGKQPIGLGTRVPMIAVSPWTVGGYVNSQVFDHTSQVRFLENWLDVRQPAISRWRRTVAGDLSSVFDFDRTTAVTNPYKGSGPRPARPLPYQPDAHGALDAGAQKFSLWMDNSGRASAHLALYPYAGEYDVPQHFDVLGAVVEAVPVKDGVYNFTLTGPNGFRREFAGETTGDAALVDVATVVDGATRELKLSITNRGASVLKVKVAPNAYSKVPAKDYDVPANGQPVVVTWKTDDAQGWYDLTLTVEQDSSYRRRFMGHIENGKESISG
ncbi:alkaline phosphatase family protein [Kitasatospora sp. NPDC127067]|uniref:alkaline phosphatase family protein n=1 Tax=Kitasatospora sp. NPDC127067 TaxID=3347126 RepID=UPI00365CC68A